MVILSSWDVRDGLNVIILVILLILDVGLLIYVFNWVIELGSMNMDFVCCIMFVMFIIYFILLLMLLFVICFLLGW